MYGWIGQLAAFVGLSIASAGAAFGLLGAWRRSARAVAWAEASAYAFFGAMAVANGAMVAALLQHDFSLRYVAQVGSRDTPPLISVVSLWSSLEGSILFWGLIIAAYAAAFAYVQRRGHRVLMGYALGIVLCVAAFFAFLIVAPANPFLAVHPVPPDGPGPNALLQNHPLMIIHPPMLYLGYVGMTVPFGIAIAA
ncbi:MAG: heme lyase CcmF/NrfE family subunit, partial [Deltaproteobacteria bacterium]